MRFSFVSESNFCAERKWRKTGGVTSERKTVALLGRESMDFQLESIRASHLLFIYFEVL